MNNESTRGAQQVPSGASADEVEQTHTGPVYTPAVDIFETKESITVLADMPGVKPDDLQIDLHESVLTLRGRAESPEGHDEAYEVREFGPGTFYRRFTLSDTINQEQIQAKLVNGVLRLQLPKAEASRPRQIPVSVR